MAQPKYKKIICHLISGNNQVACGKKGYLASTIFLSLVTCEKCKASDLYKQKDKKRIKPSVSSVPSVANKGSLNGQ
jgi:glucosamine 6-phosphate synthetase-like amidotransferase/phosphosugar isomerase protein